ncbi:MAG: ATP-binding cassette domain-containing protein, partial [Methanobacteriota archaeon]
MLKATNIHAGYGKKEVLHGVSLEVRKGEILAIIGPNGAGKSTLLKVMAGLLQLEEGEILYEGEDITRWDCPRRVEAGIVYFMQGGEVFPNLSVRENLELGWQGRNGKLNGKLEEVFQFFPDIRAWLSRRAGLLSGGQRQQVALAMVLLKQPKLLLLDEPSAGLAPKLVAEILA